MESKGHIGLPASPDNIPTMYLGTRKIMKLVPKIGPQSKVTVTYHN